ncbi:MAG: hypothetical protein ACRC14_05720 [Paracoccaceae bacterium]
MPEPPHYGPTRGELWFWLATSLGGFALVGTALYTHGIPQGPALIEVIALPTALFSYLGGRSVRRLIKRDHP